MAEEFGFDYVSAISDPAREASDLGGAVEWFDNQPPAIVESRALLEDKSRLKTLKLPDHGRAGADARPDRGRRASASRRRARSEIVEGWVEGPCAMAADLRGLNTLMLDFHDDPEFVDELFEFVVAMEVAFARAQVEAGADLIGIGDAAASLIGPRFYDGFVLPYEQRAGRGDQGDGGTRAAAHLRQHPQDPRRHGHARLRHRGPRFPQPDG